MSREIVYIAFGSNVGDRLDFCDRAVTLLGLLPASQVTGVSSLYETEPVDDGARPGSGWFLNGVVRLETEIPPHRLLDVCREVEKALGRDLEHRAGPRTLDLDLLFYGDRVLHEAGLVVPHPRLHLRRFVLAPLAELAPDLIHPVLHRTIKDLLDHLADPATVRRLDPQPSPRYGSRLGPSATPVASEEQRVPSRQPSAF
ncbi:MAG: 2-amino-4-hydroxy-6-hydroxymethyldihydropteridine diphosphokinase [Nitrospirota bacterium]